VPAVSCGIDWAEGHHDVAVVDEHGTVICAERIGNDAAGLARLLELLALHDPATGTWRWRSKPAAGCWWPGCAPPAGQS
jgi:Transposase